jgi:hypothetical protein
MWTVGRFGRFFWRSGRSRGRRPKCSLIRSETPEPDDPPLVGTASVSENRPNRPTVQPTDKCEVKR